jgi:hypothetical protein
VAGKDVLGVHVHVFLDVLDVHVHVFFDLVGGQIRKKSSE